MQLAEIFFAQNQFFKVYIDGKLFGGHGYRN